MAANLRERLSQDKIMIVPGVYDALTALLAQQAGMEAVFLSGSSVSYSQLGRPDIGLITMSEMVDICARITDRIEIPVLVDVDSGFGNAAHASRTIRTLERAGASAVQMEDQLPINPANNLKGRPLVPAAVMVDKIKAVVDARENSETLVSARSDAAFSESFDQVLERITLYREAGADILFAEGLKRNEEVKQIVDAANGVPVLYNLLHSDGDLLSAGDLDKIGISIALFPGNAVLAGALAIKEAFAGLKANPSLNPNGFDFSPKDLNAALDTPEILEKYRGFSG